MKQLYITHHVREQLAERKYLTWGTFVAVVNQLVVPLVQKYAHFKDGDNQQVAVVLGEYSKPVQIGRSSGTRVIIVVNMAAGTIPTIFARYPKQGKPRHAAVMIDLEGNVID